MYAPYISFGLLVSPWIIMLRVIFITSGLRIMVSVGVIELFLKKLYLPALWLYINSGLKLTLKFELVPFEIPVNVTISDSFWF